MIDVYRVFCAWTGAGVSCHRRQRCWALSQPVLNPRPRLLLRHFSWNLNLPLPLLLGWVAVLLRVVLVVGMNSMGFWDVLRLGKWFLGFGSRTISPIDVCFFFSFLIFTSI